MTIDPRRRLTRLLRQNSTSAEKILWHAVREAAPSWKFRRQHPIGDYIVDLACPAAKLVIELDGGQHAALSAEDTVRSRELSLRGYRVIRFWNNEVLGNLTGVLAAIIRELDRAPTSPNLSAPEGGEEYSRRVSSLPRGGEGLG